MKHISQQRTEYAEANDNIINLPSMIQKLTKNIKPHRKMKMRTTRKKKRRRKMRKTIMKKKKVNCTTAGFVRFSTISFLLPLP